MLVIGDKEQQDEKVSVRAHGKGDEGQLSADDFIKRINSEIKSIYETSS